MLDSLVHRLFNKSVKECIFAELESSWALPSNDPPPPKKSILCSFCQKCPSHSCSSTVFYFRITFDEFFGRFKCLTNVPCADHREFSQLLIDLLIKSNASINLSQIQIGKKRIFMSDQVYEYLETMRIGIRRNAVRKIWCSWCSYKLKRRIKAALIIQRCWKEYITLKKEMAAIKIQAGNSLLFF